jgi:sulfate permease, SulP family
MIMSKSLVSELLADATSRRIVPALSTGVIAAILYVIFELLFAAMIYSGDLSTLATRGAGLTLCGGFLICLFAALTSRFKATVSMPQDAPAAVLSTMALTISATLGENASMDVKFMTVAAVLTLSAFLTGVVFIIIGRFRLANLLRFMPFPVVGGFVAGIGWLFIVGGMAVMCGIPVSLDTLSSLAAPDMILKWLPGLVYGVVLFAITLRYSHVLILPGSLVAGMALFYAAIAVGGMSLDGAKAAGLLVSGVPAGGLWPAFTLKDMTLINWSAVWQQLPGIFAVVLVTVVGMLLNMSGIELAAGEEVDMNAEFMSGGVGNCLSGLGGCFPGYPAISLSLLGLKTGACTRLTGIVTALIVGGVLFIGGKLLEYFPKALLGGMLLFLGFSLIHEWIVTSPKRMPWPDYLIVASIFLVIGVFGFLQGVAFGLVAAVIFFVIRFSRVPVIKSEFTVLNRRSVKKRSVPHRKLLIAGGARIRGYELTGYLFFGSAATLVESLKSALTSEQRPDFILLDFSNISGFDISAVNNFQRFVLNANAADTAIVVTAAPDHFTEAIKRSLSKRAMQHIVFFQDIDHGLEWCEEKLIERSLSNREDAASMCDELFQQSVDDVMTYLEQQERFEHLVDCLSPWLEHREYSIGSVILEKGEPAGGLYLLTGGTATENDPDTGVRLRSLVPGNIMAAAAAFDCYTAPATIRADSDCKMAFLSLDARKLLAQEAPSLAIALHGFLIRSGSK